MKNVTIGTSLAFQMSVLKRVEKVISNGASFEIFYRGFQKPKNIACSMSQSVKNQGNKNIVPFQAVNFFFTL